MYCCGDMKRGRARSCVLHGCERMLQGQYASRCTQSGLRHRNRRNHRGRLEARFNGPFLLVHVYFIAWTVCKSSADNELESFCPRFTNEFKPAEFHAAGQLRGQNSVSATELLRKNGHVKLCHTGKTVAATCPVANYGFCSYLTACFDPYIVVLPSKVLIREFIGTKFCQITVRCTVTEIIPCLIIDAVNSGLVFEVVF